jgi:hypothetical protein
MLAKSSRNKEKDKHMSTLQMTRGIGMVMIAIMAGMASPASAASERSGKFAPANSPEETIYRPECRIVQADGTWVPSRRVECDW